MNVTPEEVLLTMALGPEGVERALATKATTSITRLPYQRSSHDHNIEAYHEQLRTIGFVLGERVNELFMDVIAPEGWAFRESDHHSYLDLVNPHGVVRGSQYHKSAPWDRAASLTLRSRYLLHEDIQPMGDGTERARYAVKDRETNTMVMVPSSGPIVRPVWPVLQRTGRAEEYRDRDGAVVPDKIALHSAGCDNYAYFDPNGAHNGRLRDAVTHVRGPVTKHTVEFATEEDHAVWKKARDAYRKALVPLEETLDAQADEMEARLNTRFPDHANPVAYWSA